MKLPSIQATVASADIVAIKQAFTSTESYDQKSYAEQISEAFTKLEMQSHVSKQEIEAVKEQLRLLWLSDEIEACKMRLRDIETLYQIQEGVKGEVTAKQLQEWHYRIQNCFTSPLKQVIKKQLDSIKPIVKEEVVESATISKKVFTDELLAVMPTEFLNAGRIVRNYCVEAIWDEGKQLDVTRVKLSVQSIYDEVMADINELGEDASSETLVAFIQKYQVKPFQTMDQTLLDRLYERTQRQLSAATTMMEVERILKQDVQKLTVNTSVVGGKAQQILSQNNENTTIQVLVGGM